MDFTMFKKQVLQNKETMEKSNENEKKENKNGSIMAVEHVST